MLASGSRYRAELLARLQVPFEAHSPDIDETRMPNESAEHLAQRLALTKARALVGRFPDRWILGSDQVVSNGALILGKPGTTEAAWRQLQLLSGREVAFLTGVALVGGGQKHQALDRTTVRVRALGAAEIVRYLDREPALDCAGSFKAEGLGISLFDEIRSTDPTGLIGLPLIAVRRLLAAAGYPVP